MTKLDLKKNKIKIKWLECVESNSNLFDINTFYPMTDKSLLTDKCPSTNTHKIFANNNHWCEFSDTQINGLKEPIKIFGSLFKLSDMGIEEFGEGKFVEYENLI